MNDLILLHKKVDALHSELAAVKQLLLANNTVPSFTDKPLTVQEAAAFTGLSVSSIYRLVREKQLHPLQRLKRGRLLFLKQSLLDFLQTKAP